MYFVFRSPDGKKKKLKNTAFNPGSTADRCAELKLAFDLFAEKRQVSCGFLPLCNMNSKVDSRKKVQF